MTAQKDALWSLAWCGSRLVSGSADGVVRIHDAADLTLPLNELSPLPLAVSSLSGSSDGKWALATSLDGTTAFVDTLKGRFTGKVETGREAVVKGQSGGGGLRIVPY